MPLGLVALFWMRMYLPLVPLGLPQAPKNRGPDGLAFAKAGFRNLLAAGVAAADLWVGAVFEPERAQAVLAAIGEAAATIAAMPANFTRFPNSDRRVFEIARERPGRRLGMDLSLSRLCAWGTLIVPGHLWRALWRFGPWIEPMLVTEWARLSRNYADRSGIAVAPGVAKAALEWREPVRSTAIARLAADRLFDAGTPVACMGGQVVVAGQIGRRPLLAVGSVALRGSVESRPCDPRVNRHEKRDRLPIRRRLRRQPRPDHGMVAARLPFR